MSNTLDDYDYCDECGGYGDDYYINDDGELVSACDDCPHNSANWEVKMNNTLLPCPFCGGESLLRDRYINGVANTKHYIRECRHCKATFAHWFRSIKKANEAWNRRAEQNNTLLALDEIISRCTPKAAELLKNGLFGAVKVCAVEKTTPKTNSDRIRSMSDEELARFLWEQNEGNRYWKSVEKYLDWLKQPAKEE